MHVRSIISPLWRATEGGAGVESYAIKRLTRPRHTATTGRGEIALVWQRPHLEVSTLDYTIVIPASLLLPLSVSWFATLGRLKAVAFQLIAGQYDMIPSSQEAGTSVHWIDMGAVALRQTSFDVILLEGKLDQEGKNIITAAIDFCTFFSANDRRREWMCHHHRVPTVPPLHVARAGGTTSRVRFLAFGKSQVFVTPVSRPQSRFCRPLRVGASSVDGIVCPFQL